jgi:excisionase family DNA binding protein
MHDPPAEREVMTLPEVCQYLRVHSSTAYRLLYAGLLPGYKVGRSWRFNRAQIEQLIKEDIRRPQQQGRRRSGGT